MPTNNNPLAHDESCPGLRAWTTCTYITFGEDLLESQISRTCIGNYLSCHRYQDHAQSSARCAETTKPFLGGKNLPPAYHSRAEVNEAAARARSSF
jgi:hypothetical protein